MGIYEWATLAQLRWAFLAASVLPTTVKDEKLTRRRRYLMTRPDRDAPESGHNPALPTWLDEACPSWCTRDHRERDHPEDRYHQSDPTMVTVTAGDGATVPVTDSLETIDMLVLLGRYVGDPRTWLTIEPAERPAPRLVLTIASARALVGCIDDQLQRVASE